MTYGRLLRYFLVITTLIFMGLWVASKGRCPQLVASTPSLGIECDVVNGTVDIGLHRKFDVRGRYGLSFYADPETRFKADKGWGRWGKNKLTAYKEPGSSDYKIHVENLPEEDYDKDLHYRKSDIPTSATISVVTHRILFPLWLPYMLIVACAFLVHRWLTRRVASRHEALVAKSGGNNPA